MAESEIKKINCSHCDYEIQDDDDFCPDCGTLFIEDVKCSIHKEKNAEGVCVICCEPLCNECGIFINGIFLCNIHGEYEILEGKARVYGSSDSLQIDYIKDCLEQNGLHPIIFSRKANAVHMGGTDYSLFRASGEFDGHIINEIKLMVPFQEIKQAEKILSELDILK